MLSISPKTTNGPNQTYFRTTATNKKKFFILLEDNRKPLVPRVILAIKNYVWSASRVQQLSDCIRSERKKKQFLANFCVRFQNLPLFCKSRFILRS